MSERVYFIDDVAQRYLAGAVRAAFGPMRFECSERSDDAFTIRVTQDFYPDALRSGVENAVTFGKVVAFDFDGHNTKPRRKTRP